MPLLFYRLKLSQAVARTLWWLSHEIGVSTSKAISDLEYFNRGGIVSKSETRFLVEDGKLAFRLIDRLCICLASNLSVSQSYFFHFSCCFSFLTSVSILFCLSGWVSLFFFSPVG